METLESKDASGTTSCPLPPVNSTNVQDMRNQERGTPIPCHLAGVIQWDVCFK